MILIYLNVIIQFLTPVIITGNVHDKNNYDIVGAKVYNNIDTTYTDFNGSFCLESDSNTKYIHIEMISFDDHTYEWDNDSTIEVKMISK